MSYKIIFTDLDDTLLNSEKKISQIDKEAIMKAQEAGIKFVLASGRPTFAMYDLAKELELENMEVLFYLSMVLSLQIVKVESIFLKRVLQKRIYI